MKFIALLLLILLAALGGFFYWWNLPAQIVDQKADDLLGLANHQKINLQTQEKKAAILADSTAPEVAIKAFDKLPSGSFSRAEILNTLETFHGFVFSLELEEVSRQTTFQDNEAWMRLKVNAKLNQGRPNARTQTLEAYLVFAQSADWKLTRAEIIEK